MDRTNPSRPWRRGLLVAMVLALGAAVVPAASLANPKPPAAPKPAKAPSPRAAAPQAPAAAPAPAQDEHEEEDDEDVDPEELLPPFRWEVPGLLTWVDSAGPQVTDGMPMVLQMALSKWPVEMLLQHFVDSAQRAGLYVPPGEHQMQHSIHPHVTAVDTVREVAYTVIFQANLDKTVTVILGTADLARYQPGAAGLEWAPLMPGAEGLTRTRMEEGESAVFSVEATPQQVLAFYREQLGAAGFKPDDDAPGSFQRGRERLQVITEKLEAEPRTQVALMRRLAIETP